MKRAVIFDFGGVLMKTVDYGPRHTWDDHLGLPRGSVEAAVHNDDSWRAAQQGALTLAAYWDDVARRLGLAADAMTQLADDFYSGDVLDESLIDLVRALRADGHPVALLSNDSAALRPRLDSLGITPLFDPLVISAEIGVLKPDAAAYQAVLDRLGITPTDAVFVDDRAENVAGARAVGMGAVHYHPKLDVSAALRPFLHAANRDESG